MIIQFTTNSGWYFGSIFWYDILENPISDSVPRKTYFIRKDRCFPVAVFFVIIKVPGRRTPIRLFPAHAIIFNHYCSSVYFTQRVALCEGRLFGYTRTMNNERFTQLFEEQVERCSDLLVKKNAEYSQGGDRLSNFRQPSSLMKMHPAEVAFCYDAKHIASIQKIVHDLSNGIVPTEEMWQEKITDYLNYGFLMNACVMEAIAKSEPS